MKHKQPQHVSVARPGCQKAAMDRDASSGGILTGYQGGSNAVRSWNGRKEANVEGVHSGVLFEWFRARPRGERCRRMFDGGQFRPEGPSPAWPMMCLQQDRWSGPSSNRPSRGSQSVVFDFGVCFKTLLFAFRGWRLGRCAGDGPFQ